MPEILNIDKFCENLKEITSTKYTKKRKFHPDGLFSEQIFGPVNNYTCQCDNYYGASNSGGTCKTCGVDIISSLERRKRFAKIVLPIRVVNPIFYDLVVSLGGNTLKRPLDILMKDEKSFIYKDGDDYLIEVKEPPKDTKIWEKDEAIFELINWIANDGADNGIKQWELVRDNIDSLFINNVIVLPPDLRPIAKGINKNKQVVDNINRFYMHLITKKESMKNTILNIQHDKSLYYTYFKQLQKEVNELYDYIISKLSKKEGLIRGNILGKRVDFSGRAIIVPEPSLSLDECSLPYLMILELFKIQIAKKLIDIKKFKLLPESLNFIEKCIEMSDPVLFPICQNIVKNEVCLLNRQPSLHRLGMIGFKIKTSLDKIIKIHPLVCAGFNADFDGDQMAVYLPISDKAKNEIKEKFMASENLSNPSNGSLIAVPSQDMILGVYILTTLKELDEVECKGEKITLGLKIFNDCLPEDYPVIKESINKKKIEIILNDIKDKYSNEITANVLDRIKEIGFLYSTVYGTSMSLKHVAIDGIDKIKDEIYSNDNIQDQLALISSKKIEDLMRSNFKYSYLVDSGARGKWDQVRQIILTRGYISNFSGDILPTPIKHNLIEGLDQEEFFNSTYGCRKGLLDVALNTGNSGYLSRKLIYTCANLLVSESVEDCGTEDYLDVMVHDKKKAKMLIGRYFLNTDLKTLDIVTDKNYQSLVGKLVRFRSPIFCKNEEICHKCYGNLYKNLHSKFIGIIAAQALGESATQLILRTFHTSGVAKVSEDQTDMRQSDIISDLSAASRALHNKEKKDYKELTDELFSLFITSRDIHHVHFECVVSQMMWKGLRKWRLLANREKIAPDYYSIQSVPEKESWILGLAFSNPKNHIIKGILQKGNYKGIFDKIMLGENPR